MTPTLLPTSVAACEKAAREAGNILLEMWGKITPHEKGPRDLVTEADLAAQDAISGVLLGEFPDHGFLGEESEGIEAPEHWREQIAKHEYCWIVDPLDGTTNYVHKLQTFAVSIGLVHQGEIVLGAVFDPVLDEYYQAVKGQGAVVNGEPLKASRCEVLDRALAATSFPANVQRGSIAVARFEELLYSCRAVRRLGSAALNLCYLAAGRLDAYWAASVKPWDVAAGVLMVREAGGVVTSIDGSPFQLSDPRFAAAATEPLHRQLVEKLTM